MYHCISDINTDTLHSFAEPPVLVLVCLTIDAEPLLSMSFNILSLSLTEMENNIENTILLHMQEQRVDTWDVHL